MLVYKDVPTIPESHNSWWYLDYHFCKPFFCVSCAPFRLFRISEFFNLIFSVVFCLFLEFSDFSGGLSQNFLPHKSCTDNYEHNKNKSSKTVKMFSSLKFSNFSVFHFGFSETSLVSPVRLTKQGIMQSENGIFFNLKHHLCDSLQKFNKKYS